MSLKFFWGNKYYAMVLNFQRQANLINRRVSRHTSLFAFSIFLTLVFFTGGSSRDDVQSLVILRPLTILFGAFALTHVKWGAWKGRTFPLFIALALSGLMILQLIPLPPEIWASLPGRQIFAEIADLAGIEQPWRPMTLSPSGAINGLFSLTVPIVAMMLYLNINRNDRKRAIYLAILLCIFSAFLAIFQQMGPSRGPLYFYQITNHGNGVGLFANRNHQAVMLASTIAMMGWYAGTLRETVKLATVKFYSSLFIILLLVPLIFVTGSRAGLILMVPALFFALFSIHSRNPSGPHSSTARLSKPEEKGRFSVKNVVLVASIFAVIGITGATIMLSRSLAFDRLVGNVDVDQLRSQVFPTLKAIATDYMPWGSGFGSFEHVYKIYEPQELLSPRYLNEAHSDWMQIIIEGGLPAVAILAAAVVWFAICLVKFAKNWKNMKSSARLNGLLCFLVILFIVAASVGDYPLRVPSIMAFFAIMVSSFGDCARFVHHREMQKC